MIDAEDMSMVDKVALLTRFYQYSDDDIALLKTEAGINEVVQECIDDFDTSSVSDFEEEFGDDEDVSLYDVLMHEYEKQDLSDMFPNASSEEDFDEELEHVLVRGGL